MSGEEKLGKLRAKLKEITEQIDDADQKKVEAKHALVDSLARLEKNEVEVNSAKRRIKLIEKDLEDSSERLKVAEEKLIKVEAEEKKIEEARNLLEEAESADDEKMYNIEEEFKESKRTLESNETKYIEAQRKGVVISRDVEKTRDKADTLEKRVAVLEQTIASAGESLVELEEREGESSEREEINEEKLIFLAGQFKESEVRAEAAERSCNVLERNIFETENEINTWIQKRKEIEDEMIEMDTVADEPDDE
uniref:Tropomyosin-2 n=1 Tax=Podocoryna carnea TaxID=6096 RepID=TPM2_PODCA|nr:RecName: Full=Tropomyosin-2 [Podocoryna carnea]CAB55601.1 tropomyosin [Podocoryna carnea]